uniref:Integrase core domain containing protein n=1 Tax=Solanum tuberosum TaxID=4113 RepID=M1DFX7_SOLTU
MKFDSDHIHDMDKLDEFHLKAYGSSSLCKEKKKNHRDQKFEKREFTPGVDAVTAVTMKFDSDHIHDMDKLDEFHLKAYRSSSLCKEKKKKHRDQKSEKREFTPGVDAVAAVTMKFDSDHIHDMDKLDEFHLKAYGSSSLCKEKNKKHRDQKSEKRKFTPGVDAVAAVTMKF